MANSVQHYKRRKTGKGTPSSILRFLRWWVRELSALVPIRLRPPQRPPRGLHWITQGKFGLTLSRLTPGKLTKIADLKTDGLDPEEVRLAFDDVWRRHGRPSLGICLSPDRVLRRTMVLPWAARNNILQVLGFEIGRATPFNTEQVYSDFVIQREDLKKGQLHVQLSLTPKATLETLLSQIGSWGVQINYIGIEDELSRPGQCANLLPTVLRQKSIAPWKWIYTGMAVVTLFLAALVLAIPLWQKREVAIALLSQESKVASIASDVSRQRTELEQQVEQYNFTLAQKYTRPPVVAVMEEVTRILPDDTWLQQLDINFDKVLMQGSSNSPARLIGLFEKSKLLGDANFTSPLVKGREGEERFQLEVLLKATSLQEALEIHKVRNNTSVPKKTSTNTPPPKVSSLLPIEPAIKSQTAKPGMSASPLGAKK
jgi:general secretion pathway protein L